MFENTPQPSPDPQLQRLTPVSQETLVDYLAYSLDSLEAACLPLPGVEQQHLLWFHPHEYEMVNSVWESRGISGVMNEWGEARTFASGHDVDVWSQPKSLLQPLPAKPVVLIVADYGLDDSPESIRAALFRSTRFAVSDSQKDGIVETLTNVGLLDRVIPLLDDLTGALLRGSPIVGVACGAEWHASHNSGRGRTKFTLSLTIAPPGCEEEVVSLTLDSAGNLFRRMLSQSFMESGYEGHSFERYNLAPEELRALLAIVNEVRSKSDQRQTNFQTGMWLYHSIP